MASSLETTLFPIVQTINEYLSNYVLVILLLGLCSLFWHTSITGMVVLLVLTYALEIVVDNVCARMTWGWMLKHAFGITLGLAIFNILWLYVR